MLPSTIVFDVNETLSDLSPMEQHFAEVGVPEGTARLWFTSLLRDGFALTAAGANPRFAEVAEGALRVVLAGQPLNRSEDEALKHLLGHFRALPVHADAGPGIAALAESGHRLVTLTNGPRAAAESLLERAGLRGHFDLLLSVEDAPLWKPAPEAYAHAADACGEKPEDLMLVAAHPWDIDGAARAGMRTAWVDRTNAAYPGYARTPDLVVGGIADLARRSGH